MSTLTLGEVCTRLRITRRTLDKWLTRLSIAPSQHPYDRRFWLIQEEDMERIRAARAEMPSASAPMVAYRPPLSPLLLDPPDPPAATPRMLPRTVSVIGHSPGHHEPLPDGWMAWIRLSEELGLPGTTARRYIDKHLIDFHEGEWDSGVADRPFKYALDPEQQEAARRIVQTRRPR